MVEWAELDDSSSRCKLLEHNGGQHSAHALYNVACHKYIDTLLQMSFRILFANVFNGQLFRCHLLLFFERFVVVVRQIKHGFHRRLVDFTVFVVVLQAQAVDPTLLVQIEQHLDTG